MHEITIAGNLREMFQRIVAVGADAYTMGSKTIGSVLIERMKIAGRLSAGEPVTAHRSARVNPGEPRAGALPRIRRVPNTSSHPGDHSMERRSFIRKTGIAGVLAAGAAPAIVHAQADDPLAPGLELPEVARHHLRRRRSVRQEGRAT